MERIGKVNLLINTINIKITILLFYYYYYYYYYCCYYFNYFYYCFCHYYYYSLKQDNLNIRIISTINIDVFSRKGINLEKKIDINAIKINNNNNNSAIDNNTTININRNNFFKSSTSTIITFRNSINNNNNNNNNIQFHTVQSLQDISSSKVRLMIPNFFDFYNELKRFVHPEVYKYMKKNKLFGFKKNNNNDKKTLSSFLKTLVIFLVIISFIFLLL
jgi:hypothetical protein